MKNEFNFNGKIIKQPDSCKRLLEKFIKENPSLMGKKIEFKGVEEEKMFITLPLPLKLRGLVIF